MREKPTELIEKGVEPRFAMRTFVFWGLVVATFCLAIDGGYKTNVTGIAVEFLGDTGFAPLAPQVSAFMLSMIAISDLVSNLIAGLLIDRTGVRIPIVSFCAITLMIFICWIGFGHSIVGLYLGAFCFGFHGAILRVCIPQLTRETFGQKNFPEIWGRIVMWKGIMGGLSGTIVAMFYDFGGSYMGSLWFGLVLVLIAICALIYAMHVAKIDRYGVRVNHV
jgi:MFS family permease